MIATVSFLNLLPSNIFYYILWQSNYNLEVTFYNLLAYAMMKAYLFHGPKSSQIYRTRGEMVVVGIRRELKRQQRVIFSISFTQR